MRKISKIMIISLTTLIMLVELTLPSKAETETKTSDNLEYTVESDNTITIRRLLNRTTVTDVIIPEKIEGKEVTTISSQFATPSSGEVTALRKITIPKTVKYIGNEDYYGAFENVAKLEEIIVDGSSPYYCSVDGVLYNKDKTTIVAYPANKQGENYTILNGVTKIAACAFAFCKNLKNVSIPNTTTELKSNCFAHASLEDVTLPKSIIKMDTDIFYNCDSLKSATINIDTYINLGAFQNCDNLTTVHLGDDVSTIRSSAFEDCPNLSDINLETAKVVSIEFYAFRGCNSLPNKITFNEEMKEVSKDAFEDYIELKFKANDIIEGTDIWEKCVMINVNATQNYTDAYEVFRLTNEEREKENLKPLKLDKNLMDIAMQRAYEISVYYEHRRPEIYRGYALGDPNYDTKIFIQDTLYRMKLTGITNFSGENISYGYYTPENAMNGWMSSPGHKSNILGKDYTTMGVGAIKTSNGDYFWVQIFGTNEELYSEEKERSNKEEKRVIPASVSYVSEVEDREGITLEADKTSINTKEKMEIKVKSYFYDANYSTYLTPDSFTWSSSNDGILTVNQEGIVTGVSAGTADVIMTMSNGKTRKLSITVSEKYKKGDVDGDGFVTISDCLAILRHVKEIETLSGEKLERAKIDNNNMVTISDYTALLRSVKEIELLQ